MKDVISEDEIGNKEMKAKRLKDNHTKWWDVQKVRSYFLPTIANENLKIVLSTIDHDNTQIWTHEKYRNFSVRNAYRFFKELEVKARQEEGGRAKF